MKLLTTILFAFFMAVTGSVFADDPNKVTVGFIYVGPTGDHGWTYMHDIGRKQILSMLKV